MNKECQSSGPKTCGILGYHVSFYLSICIYINIFKYNVYIYTHIFGILFGILKLKKLPTISNNHGDGSPASWGMPSHYHT